MLVNPFFSLHLSPTSLPPSLSFSLFLSLSLFLPSSLLIPCFPVSCLIDDESSPMTYIVLFLTKNIGLVVVCAFALCYRTTREHVTVLSLSTSICCRDVATQGFKFRNGNHYKQKPPSCFESVPITTCASVAY